jgi:hypothetical protein
MRWDRSGHIILMFRPAGIAGTSTEAVEDPAADCDRLT